ncbi:MAG: sigma-54-dependent Fis family transcriptional regulator [Nitrospirae bacterium]|nr:sigma-54-dependent Fis family transcriptional regulator [Nitrospirota bacterium]
MKKNEHKVLLVDDEPNILLSQSIILRSAGIEAVKANDSREVMPLLGKGNISVVVLDLTMPHIPGEKLLAGIKYDFPHIPVIIMTANNVLEKAVECMRLGAMDYLVKPVEKSRFLSSVQRAIELSALRDEVSSLSRRLMAGDLQNEEAFSSIITRSRKIRSIFNYIEVIARSPRPVCITGETGVGKELFANAVHNASGLKGNFVAVNAAGLDDTVFSDTLFGHVKGAFTGADKERNGLIEKASGGTLLLDEIGDLNESSQIKLLRLLEDGSYYPLGSDLSGKSTARIIVTTNRDLSKEAGEGKFRKDLYYRLSAHYISIPPLRERLEDIPLLLNHFLAEASASLYKSVPDVMPELVSLLSDYSYPGNVRELQSMIFDAVSQHKAGPLPLESFRSHIKNNVMRGRGKPHLSEGSLFSMDISGRFPTLKDADDFLISEALKRSGGNQKMAAGLLGITRQALNKRLTRIKSPHNHR